MTHHLEYNCYESHPRDFLELLRQIEYLTYLGGEVLDVGKTNRGFALRYRGRMAGVGLEPEDRGEDECES